MKHKIIVAKYAGFCSGVKNAVDTAFLSADNNNGELYAYGELIHNESVNCKLADKGVRVVDDITDLKDATIIIRSHGVSKQTYQTAAQNNNTIIDTTCVFVKRVHDIVQQHDKEGYQIVIIGNAKHPEVIGISGWCHNAVIINSLAEAKVISSPKPLCVVAQTTLNDDLYQTITRYFKSHYSDALLYKTICAATRKRQDEAREIAKKVDFMIVIGGKNSSNTKKLYDISKKICKNAQLIQNFNQIDVKLLQKYVNIGIVAGASTPDWIIDEVISKLKNKGEVVINGK